MKRIAIASAVAAVVLAVPALAAANPSSGTRTERGWNGPETYAEMQADMAEMMGPEAYAEMQADMAEMMGPETYAEMQAHMAEMMGSGMMGSGMGSDMMGSDMGAEMMGSGK